MKVGKAIRRYRKFRDMSQKQLAGVVGCSKATISSIEQGSRQPSLKMVERIAEAVGATVNAIFHEAEQF